jgi:hypothetical protein
VNRKDERCWRPCSACDGRGSSSEWDSPYTTTRVRCDSCNGDGGYYVSAEAAGRSEFALFLRDHGAVTLDEDEWFALGGLLS